MSPSQGSVYVNTRASIAMLEEACFALGVVKHTLIRLLGVSEPGNGYRWFSGSSRPSALYLARLAHLLSLRSMRKLDWEPIRADPNRYWASVGYWSEAEWQRMRAPKPKDVVDIRRDQDPLGRRG